MPPDPYNELVRAHFGNPVHAAAPSGAYALNIAASASESGDGCRVTLSAGIDGGRIAEMRFRAWGCPFLLAAAETLCRDLEGKPVSALGAVSANDLAARLSPTASCPAAA